MIGSPGIGYAASLVVPIWILRAAEPGSHVLDARGRLGIPIGMRSLLGVVDGGPLGCSTAGDCVVLWSVRHLDAVVVNWLGEGS